jgi:non-specific serine/threonine protein kinase
VGDAQGTALALAGLADLARDEGAVARAVDLAREGLLALRGAADPQPLANVAEAAVVADAARDAGPGAAEQRARVLGAIEVMREATRLARAPGQDAVYQRVIAATRLRLGDEAFAAAWEQGRDLSPGAALEAAVVLLAPATSPARSTARAHDARGGYGRLSAREAEVAALIGRGMTSKEIADRLVITERTADTHAGHIRDKLGLRSRAEIAAWAVRHGLLPEDEPVAPR